MTTALNGLYWQENGLITAEKHIYTSALSGKKEVKPIKKVKFSGIFRREPYLWIIFMGAFAVPFFISLLYNFKFSAKIRWEFLIIVLLFLLLYHVAQLKYHEIPELRND